MITAEDRVFVRRHHVRYRVARGGSRAAVLDTNQSALETMLGERLSAILQSSDEAVWLIRRLDVRVPVGTASTPSGVANSVAAAVATALARTFEAGPDGDNVRHYPDRAAFIGRLLLDCAEDRAARGWEYEEFGQLAQQTSSRAIRSIVGREPESSLDALMRMTPRDLRVMLASLSPVDAEAVLVSLGSIPSSSRTDPAAEVVDALAVLLARSDLPTPYEPAALTLFLEVARSRGARPPAGTVGRALAIAKVSATLRSRGLDESGTLARAVGDGDARAVDAPAMAGLAEIIGWPSHIRSRAVRTLVETLAGKSIQAEVTDRRATDLGGTFLLLPLLSEFPWSDAAATLPGLDMTEPARLLQYLTVIAVLGAGRNAVAAGDPVLRLAVGIPPEVDARSIYRWAQGLGAAETRCSIGVLTRHLHLLGKVSGAVTLAPLEGGVVAVDAARGTWLGTAPGEPASIRDLISSIDAALGTAAAVAASQPWIEACIQPGRRQPAPIDERFLSRLDEQSRHTSVGAPFDLAPPMSDLVTVAAHALARELAWRLPGFSTSTLPYLWENFLSFAAEISFEPQRNVVRVADPPLHLVLSLAGMNRRRFHLEATGDREWVLTQRH